MDDPLALRIQRLEQELDELRSTADADRRQITKLQDQLDGCRAAILSVLRQVPESFLPTDGMMPEPPDDDDDDQTER